MKSKKDKETQIINQTTKNNIFSKGEYYAKDDNMSTYWDKREMELEEGRNIFESSDFTYEQCYFNKMEETTKLYQNTMNNSSSFWSDFQKELEQSKENQKDDNNDITLYQNNHIIFDLEDQNNDIFFF